MAYQQRNQPWRRTTGGDWPEDSGYDPQRIRRDYEAYQGYRSDYENPWRENSYHQPAYGYGASGGRGESGWRRRSVHEMEEYPQDAYYEESSARPDPYRSGGSYGAGYRQEGPYTGGYYEPFNRGYDPYEAGPWSQSAGHQGYGFNRRGYGRSGELYQPERYREENRDWWDRTTDEVASWFGDEDAERRRRMDSRQDYRERGPKGYRRPDERIREEINDRLSDDPWVDASEIEVSVTDGEVSLSGKVSDRMAKRRAEDIVDSVSGVRDVANRIRVHRAGSDVQDDADFRYPTATTTGGSVGIEGRAEADKNKPASSSSV